MSTRRSVLLALATVAMATTALAAGDKFQVNDPYGRNSVTFKSEAPLEDIVGTSNEVTGYLVFDPADPDAGVKGKVEVPVASLDTGIPLRDEHLQSAGWLDAENHPKITLEVKSLKSIEQVKSGDGFRTFDVVAVVNFSLHGKSQRMEIPARVTYLQESDRTKELRPGDLLAVRSSFDVTLADFGVTGPPDKDIIGNKVGETVTVDVSFRASNAES